MTDWNMEDVTEPGADTQGGSSGGMSANKKDEEQNKIPADLNEVLDRLEREIGYNKSFDVGVREMKVGERRTALLFVSGLVDSEMLSEVLKRISYADERELNHNALQAIFDVYAPAIQVVSEDNWGRMITYVLGGGSSLFVDGATSVILIEARKYPARGPEEPSIEKVVRGSRDGFVETLMTNVSLVRRRLRDPELRYELLQVGERTRTDICIAYINDLVDYQLLDSIREKIKAVELDGLPLADKQLSEATQEDGWNPFPLVRYSERPDTVSAHLLEGAIAVFVDTSPSVMTLPTTYADLIQHAEENRQTAFIGTYLRWVRFLGIMASLFLLPIWLLFVMHPELKPPSLDFIGPEETGKLPLLVQFLLAEVGVDLMRMASVHTPASLATAMSLVAAILIGDIAVQTGVFVNEVILYMAIAAIGMFATPSYELGLANRIVRLVLIIGVAAFQVPGFVVTTTLIFLWLVLQRSFNRPYMWPLIPFDAGAMWNILVRKPVLRNRLRPNLYRPQQRQKMPNKKEEE